MQKTINYCQGFAVLEFIGDARWLHISDFHFKSGDRYDQDLVTRALLNSLPDLVARSGKPDFVVASGDIAFSGRAEEYAVATIFFDKLLEILGLERSSLFIVPGNHDVDRPKGVGLVRSLYSSEDADIYFSPNGSFLHISQKLEAFANWHDQFFSGIRVFERGQTYSIAKIECSGTTVQIALFNSAAFCIDDEDSGKLFVGRRQVERAAQATAGQLSTLKIAVLHHPLSWLSPIESSNVKAFMQDAFDCILTGHLHENEVEAVSGSSGASLHLAAGACYQTTKYPNTAMFCRYDGASFIVTPIRFGETPRPMWVLDTTLFPCDPTYEGRFAAQRTAPTSGTAQGALISVPAFSTASVSIPDILPNDSDEVIAARAALEERLFTTPSSRAIYAEPRLMCQSQLAVLQESSSDGVPLDEVARSTESYLIESRPEYGSSTLCRALHLKIVTNGMFVAHRSARSLPNYKK